MYQEMLIYFENSITQLRNSCGTHNSGFCLYIKHNLDDSFTTDNFKIDFPELYAQKPKKTWRNSAWWWKLSNNKKRAEALKKALTFKK